MYARCEGWVSPHVAPLDNYENNLRGSQVHIPIKKGHTDYLGTYMEAFWRCLSGLDFVFVRPGLDVLTVLLYLYHASHVYIAPQPDLNAILITEVIYRHVMDFDQVWLGKW